MGPPAWAGCLMARIAAPEPGRSEGLYQFLAEAEEAEFRGWQDRQARRVSNGYEPETYPRQRRLEAVRAGAPVTVFDYDVPGERRSGSWPSATGRVVVSPDDTVRASAEDGMRAWLEEQGEAPPGWAVGN